MLICIAPCCNALHSVVEVIFTLSPRSNEKKISSHLIDFQRLFQGGNTMYRCLSTSYGIRSTHIGFLIVKKKTSLIDKSNSPATRECLF